MNRFTHPEQHDENHTAGSKPLVSRLRASLIHGSLVLFAMALIARAIQVQLIDGPMWAQSAAKQQIRQSDLAAPRGQILDERGVVLAESRELVQISIAPNQVRRDRTAKLDERRELLRGLTALGVSKPLIHAALDSTKTWVEIPKSYVPRDVEGLLKLHGVKPQFVMQRVIAAPEGVRRLIGVMDAKGVPVGGIEQELDSLLRGQTGRRTSLRDGRGKYFDTPSLTGVDATPGHAITLTINSTLQDICERELQLALQRTGASGGDVVIVDPRDGSILALAGYRDRKVPLSSTPLAEGYEPGSVLKTFIVGNLLERGLVTPDDMVNTEYGPYIVDGKPWPTDEHKAPSMSVRDVIRNSSNIGIVRLAAKLSSSQEYEVLRDFGFGVQPGTPYPAESRGRVVLPKTWSDKTAASMAMGYQMLVTPLQLAVAYAAVANGGELLQPALVREIRDADGTVVFRHQRRPLRRVLSPKAAEQTRLILESVVDSGSGVAAGLQTFDVAGKSGTSRRTENGHYIDGRYNATFVGMFPATKPQYVVVARLIDPKGLIFGGKVAAPVVNRILQGAMATRDAQLDRSALAEVARPVPVKVDTVALRAAEKKDSIARAAALKKLAKNPAVNVAGMIDSAELVDTTALIVRAAPKVALPAPTTIVVQFPYKPKAIRTTPAELVQIPNVVGLDLRDAVRTLYAAGFQVKLVDGGNGRTKPLAGSFARAGTAVVLESGR